MSAEQLSEEYLSEKNEITKLLIDKILQHLKDGEIPKTKRETYTKIYNFTQKYSNKDLECKDLYSYYNKVITEFATELANQLKDKANLELIDGLIDKCNRIDFLINFMLKTFSFLDFYYIKFAKIESLTTVAHGIYKNILLIPLQNKVKDELNNLLKDEKANEDKIKKIQSILALIELINPKLIIKDKKVTWEGEKPEEKKEEEKKEEVEKKEELEKKEEEKKE